jgi:hypothetical protein
VLSDAEGLPLVVGASAANTADITAFKPLFMAIPPIRSRGGPRRRRPDKARADKAYDSADLRRWLRQRGVVPRIARRGIESSEHPGAGYLKAIDMAAMLTARTYVPADSSHEITMATALADAGRSFVKPLRYDAQAETLPDFALLDCDPPVYVEVYGITGNAAYQARKQEARHYQQTGRPVIEWYIADPLPDLTTP